MALAEGDGPWVFIGIIPMIDPPRHDTPQTIYKIQAAGVRVSRVEKRPVCLASSLGIM